MVAGHPASHAQSTGQASRLQNNFFESSNLSSRQRSNDKVLKAAPVIGMPHNSKLLAHSLNHSTVELGNTLGPSVDGQFSQTPIKKRKVTHLSNAGQS